MSPSSLGCKLGKLPVALLALVGTLLSGCALVSEAPRAGGASGAAFADPEPELPAGVEQILPRGALPAIFEPRFVPGGAARIPGDAWVLGVVLDGVAKAYSLALLNGHEVVNDASATRSFAAVW